MKITNIVLDGWRSFQHAELPLSRYSFFRGANHVGKSGIADAIQYALTGRNDSTDARGAGAKDLIRPGAEKARIEMDTIAGGAPFKIRCSLSDKSGRTVTVKTPVDDESSTAANDIMEHGDVFNILCNSRHFVERLKADEQKDLLSSLLLPDTYEWPKAIVDAVLQAQLTVDLQGKPFDVISKAYDLAFAARTNVNRDLKNFAFPEGDVTLAGPVDAINAKLSELRGEKDKHIREQSRRSTILQRQKTEAVTAKNAIGEFEERVATHEKAMTEAKPNILAPKAIKELTAKAAGAKRAAEINQEIWKLDQRDATLTAALKNANALGDNPICPTCKRVVDADVVASIADPIADQIRELRDKALALDNERAGLGDFELADKTLKAHEAAQAQFDRAKERKTEAEAQLKRAKEAFEKLEAEDPGEPGELAPKIEEIEARLVKGTEHLSKVTAANTRKEAQAEAGKRRDLLVKKQANLEKLVTYFGPKGIQADLLAKSVDPFRESMNAVLEKWGYQCEFSFEPYQFGVKSLAPNAMFRQLRVMSKSEKLRFGVAFQVAIAVATGLRFVIVDEADMLDTDGRKQLVMSLIHSDLDQAIILQTDERRDKVPTPEQFKDSVFYMVTAEDDEEGTPTTSVERLMAGV